jgi:hypothetical protein
MISAARTSPQRLTAAEASSHRRARGRSDRCPRTPHGPPGQLAAPPRGCCPRIMNRRCHHGRSDGARTETESTCKPVRSVSLGSRIADRMPERRGGRERQPSGSGASGTTARHELTNRYSNRCLDDRRRRPAMDPHVLRRLRAHTKSPRAGGQRTARLSWIPCTGTTVRSE